MSVAAGQAILAQDIIKSVPWYAADAGSNDTYAISLPTAPSAYSDGAVYRFKANTANSGASSLNVNSLGAIAIKRPDTTDTQTGDIVANQIVEVVYRGGSFYMTSPSPIEERFTVGALRNTLVKTYFNIQLLFLRWQADDSGGSPTKSNWVYSAAGGAAVVFQPGGAMAYTADTGADSFYVESPFIRGAATNLEADDTNIIIMDWWAKLPATSTGDINMGFSLGNDDFVDVYNSSSGGGRVVFSMRGSTGVIYATISKNGVGVTNTDVSSGITNTNWNNFRIELDLSNNALFYINGILVATLSGANLPNNNGWTIWIGFGRSNTAAYAVTAPNISLQMNP